MGDGDGWSLTPSNATWIWTYQRGSSEHPAQRGSKSNSLVEVRRQFGTCISTSASASATVWVARHVPEQHVLLELRHRITREPNDVAVKLLGDVQCPPRDYEVDMLQRDGGVRRCHGDR
jgi:hypothetical protein